MSRLSLQQEIQRLSTPDYPTGYSIPENYDNQSIPEDSGLNSAVASPDHGGISTQYATKGQIKYALTGSPNSYGWRQQDAMEVGAYRETCVSLNVAAGDHLVIDPNQASVWEILAAGSFSFSIPPGAVYDPPDVNAPTPNVAISLVLRVRLAPGAVIGWPYGLLWDLTLPASTWTPPTALRDDVYVLVCTPVLGWFGEVINQGLV